MAVASDGTIYTWGRNASGQLGNGTTSTGATSLPQVVPGLDLSPAPVEVSITASTVESYAPGSAALTAVPIHPQGMAYVSNVKFYSQGVLVGQVNSSPWKLNLGSLSAGNYHVYAIVTDAYGITGYSAPLDFTILPYDSDADGMGDEWEIARFGSLDALPGDDADNDGWTNLDEFTQNSDPNFQDSDFDGWLDSDEQAYFGSLVEPGSGDYDGDGLLNSDETMIHGSHPALWDTNGDGASDWFAWMFGADITGSDSDGDGLTAIQELAKGTSVVLADTDGDGVNDAADYFPLDVTAWNLPGGANVPGAPMITLLNPPGAVLAP